ncbi:MAG: class I SAM-dependent methyltransferase [Bacilli bacterium]|jgi:ubiquinone/menaquinone biosynthesis C-methylase UbiE|nr:class I SAM-dependent methyltransferase [Bacilli bacterium]
MEKNGLNSQSKAYYEKQRFYEIFSRAEDYSKKLDLFFKKHIKGRKILDAGCGSGKFLPLLERLVDEYVGIDLSEEQIKEAQKKINKKNSILQVGDLEKLNFLDASFDVVISSWVLGTITDEMKRKNVIDELKRVLKPNGTIYLIENDSDGEFEKLRGHIQRTEEYNNWLIKQGFQIIQKLETNFHFSDLEEVRTVFGEIYGKQISNQIKAKKINHHILIFKYKLTQ